MLTHRIVAEVMDSDRAFVTQVAPQVTDCTLRMNATSTAYLTVGDGHSVIPKLEAEGMRAALWLRVSEYDRLVGEHLLLEGRVGDVTGTGPRGSVKIPILDDFDWFSRVLGWQGPAIVARKIATEFATYTGPSDTRALAAISAAVTRLGLPWDVVPSSGLGTVGTTDLRMDPLGSKLLDALTADRLQLRIRRNRATDRFVVDVVRGVTFPRVLTPQSGVLTTWQWIRQQPTLTRVVVGGRGDKVDREFVTVVDAALEAQLGMVLEGFVNASSADEGADLTALGWEALAAARGKAGISATLREQSWFQFPSVYGVGDRVSLAVGPTPVDDVITEVHITQDTRSGFRAVPKVGLAITDPKEQLTRTVASWARAVQRIERG